MMAPSTMASGGTGAVAKAVTLCPLPDGLSSTALTVLEPMSRPTTGLTLRNTRPSAFLHLNGATAVPPHQSRELHDLSAEPPSKSAVTAALTLRQRRKDDAVTLS